MLELSLQDNRVKLYPGTIGLAIKVWDLFKEETNKGNTSLLGILLQKINE